MNIIDKSSFKKFLKEPVLLFLYETALLKAIRSLLRPGNFINRFIKINYIPAYSSLKLNYI
jgi:hypothetical protein